MLSKIDINGMELDLSTKGVFILYKEVLTMNDLLITFDSLLNKKELYNKVSITNHDGKIIILNNISSFYIKITEYNNLHYLIKHSVDEVSYNNIRKNISLCFINNISKFISKKTLQEHISATIEFKNTYIHNSTVNIRLPARQLPTIIANSGILKNGNSDIIPNIELRTIGSITRTTYLQTIIMLPITLFTDEYILSVLSYLINYDKSDSHYYLLAKVKGTYVYVNRHGDYLAI